MRYCQKPIEVEAFQLTEDVDIIAPKWFADAVQEEKVVIDRILHDGAACVYGCSKKIGDTLRKPDWMISSYWSQPEI